METVILLFIVICLGSIVWQDFKHREVYLINYFILYIFYAIYYFVGDSEISLWTVIINSCISLAVASMLIMYYLLRYNRQAFKKIKSSIGWGDILIIPLFIFNFSPSNFTLIYLASLVISLSYAQIANCNRELFFIPLAGIQSAIIVCCIILDYSGLFNMQIDFYTYM